MIIGGIINIPTTTSTTHPKQSRRCLGGCDGGGISRHDSLLLGDYPLSSSSLVSARYGECYPQACVLPVRDAACSIDNIEWHS
eukprot:CAMPEP_0201948820 /NCGR_PEP_ID=MMETSP0903-20130614/55658_1 /ASSEMBLY_ACC=CAM_ASM_000552 /TAXON_ID=420261 /ORGANISM="Thalassiosira antarctica, Strain CCMP982" /LENGTH=82 /DNA_ID=CAMNT_0048492015 /DNA_START=1117 /DNA_END=1365 /DNA_ORIENTATION=+